MILFLHFLGEGEHIFISIRVSCSLLGGSKMFVLSLHENEGDVYRWWEVKEVNCATQYFLSSSTFGELFHVHGKEDNIFKMSILPNLVCDFNAVPTKHQASYFTDIKKLIQKYIWKDKNDLELPTQY